MSRGLHVTNSSGTAHTVVRYGTHSCQVGHTQLSSTTHTVVKNDTHKHVMYLVMTMTGHGLYIYRVRKCHIQCYVRSYVTKNAYGVLQKTPMFFQEFYRLYGFSQATLRSLLRLYEFNILPILITALLDFTDEYHPSRLILTCKIWVVLFVTRSEYTQVIYLTLQIVATFHDVFEMQRHIHIINQGQDKGYSQPQT